MTRTLRCVLAPFLTLVVAETVGVKSGLGWYLSWAQGWAEYGKVFAALVIMALARPLIRRQGVAVPVTRVRSKLHVPTSPHSNP